MCLTPWPAHSMVQSAAVGPFPLYIACVMRRSQHPCPAFYLYSWLWVGVLGKSLTEERIPLPLSLSRVDLVVHARNMTHYQNGVYPNGEHSESLIARPACLLIRSSVSLHFSSCSVVAVAVVVFAAHLQFCFLPIFFRNTFIFSPSSSTRSAGQLIFKPVHSLHSLELDTREP
ncbi:hypothetical protein LY78DRAFT_238866 [Colletotrichum sublineola]|nr:hypothetical protein LY78DRAFT_238866 [Colletotrichum sublineola]